MVSTSYCSKTTYLALSIAETIVLLGSQGGLAPSKVSPIQPHLVHDPPNLRAIAMKACGVPRLGQAHAPCFAR